MKFIRKHWRLVFTLGLPVVLLAFGGMVYWAGAEIASPSRREVMDYHREFLTNQAAHGIRIDPFTADDGTPCLVVIPTGSPGARGKLIRKQLLERGLSLQHFGGISGTLVLNHGRRGRKEDYLPIAERLCAVGFRCVIPDLPGHGDHPAKTATYGVMEAGLPARVLDEAARKFGFEKRPSGLMGMSMGGSVAMHAADRAGAPWSALVIVSSFDSFPSVIRGQATRHAGIALGPWWSDATGAIYQWKTGVPLEDIQPRNHAANIRIPTLVAHGTVDRVVPVSAGKRLFAALPGTTPKKWVEVPGADHDNVLITDYPIYADIAEWMLRHVPVR